MVEKKDFSKILNDIVAKTKKLDDEKIAAKLKEIEKVAGEAITAIENKDFDVANKTIYKVESMQGSPGTLAKLSFKLGKQFLDEAKKLENERFKKFEQTGKRDSDWIGASEKITYLESKALSSFQVTYNKLADVGLEKLEEEGKKIYEELKNVGLKPNEMSTDSSLGKKILKRKVFSESLKKLNDDSFKQDGTLKENVFNGLSDEGLLLYARRALTFDKPKAVIQILEKAKKLAIPSEEILSIAYQVGNKCFEKAEKNESLSASEKEELVKLGMQAYDMTKKLAEDYEAKMLEKEKLIEEYSKQTREADVFELKRIESKLGKDTPKINEKDLQEGYAKLARQSQFYDIDRLVEKTGIKPKISEKDAQEGYNKIVRDKDPSVVWLRRLFQLTGIMPDLPNDVLQEMYSKMKTVGDMEEIRKITKVKPTKETVQKIYERCLNSDFLSNIQSIRKLTGVAPSEELIMNAYKKMLDSKNLKANKVATLEKYSGVKISDEVVQDAYKGCINDCTISQMKTIMEHTKINPSKETIMGMYKKLAEKKNIGKIKSLETLTGIESPDEYKKK